MRSPQFTRSIVHSAFCIALSATASAATWYASPTGTADAACTAEEPGTIQAAFNKAAKGSSWETADEVVLLAGVYDYSNPVWSGKNCVEVPKSRDYITIRSASGNPADAVLLGRGGETYVSADLLTTNEPFYARAVYTASRLRLQGITITNFHNNANGAAGSCATSGYLVLEDCIVTGNSGASAINLAAATRTFFLNNANTGAGGAAYKPSTLRDCLFVGNVGTSAGAACQPSGSIIGCTFSNNTATAGNGGAITIANLGRNTITNCLFFGNSASGSDGGGAIHGTSHTIYNSVFIGNSAPKGGAVYYGGTYWNCRFERNTSTSSGGAAHNGIFHNCAFVENQGGSCGAGYHIKGYNCTFIGNSATGSGGALGGQGVNDYSRVHDSLFFGNRAPKCGVAENVELRGCLIISNETTTTTDNNRSGLLYVRGPINCTFIGNKVATTGILTLGASNCLLYDNSPRDLSSKSATYYNCLYGTASASGPTLNSCVQADDPRFNLGRNPKRPWYALRPHSPAIDAGAEQSWATGALDLAGNPRLNGPIDIGCYEFWPSTDATTVMLQ